MAAPPSPIARGQGNAAFRSERQSVVLKRGQTVPYNVNGAPSGATVADGDYGDVVVSGGVWSFDSGVVSTFSRTYLNDPDAPAVRLTLGLGALALLGSVNDANWSGADLAISNGGTGASSASAARANLGLVIGTDIQAYHTNLDGLAALTLVQGDILYLDASGLQKLAAGTSGNFLKTNGAGADPAWAAADGISSGTSFPVSPSDGDRFRRSDRNRDYFYSSAISNWLSEQEFWLPVMMQGALNNVAVSTFVMGRTALPYTGTHGFYVDKIVATTNTNPSTTTSTNYMTLNFYHVTASAGTLLGSFSTQNDAANQQVAHSVSVASILASTVKSIHFDAVETLNVNGFSIEAFIIGRLVG